MIASLRNMDIPAFRVALGVPDRMSKKEVMAIMHTARTLTGYSEEFFTPEQIAESHRWLDEQILLEQGLDDAK